MRIPSPVRSAPVLVAAALIALVVPHGASGAPSASTTVASAANGQGELVVVGDSLTEGAEYFGNLRRSLLSTRLWPRVTVDYKRGRTVRQGIPVLTRRLAAATNPTAIVIALGTNDMMSHSEPGWPAQVIDEMMQETMGLPVLWVNITFDRARHPDWKLRANRFNRALAAASTEWPTLTVANWSAGFVPSGRVRFIADGVHLTVSAYRVRSSWITSRARDFGRRAVDSSTTTTSTTILPPATTAGSSTTTLPSSTTTVAVTTTT